VDLTSLVSNIKKTDHKPTSALAANINLANKLQKENGVSTKANDQSESINDYEEKVENSEEITNSIQPNLDPYNLIPEQFHEAFKIKPSYVFPEARGAAIDEPRWPSQPAYRWYYAY